MKPSFPEYQLRSPLRTPDWRWRRACFLVDRGRYFCRRRDDRETGRAVRYLRALACPHGRLAAQVAKHDPTTGAAHRLRQDNGKTRWYIEALLLARQTSEQ